MYFEMMIIPHFLFLFFASHVIIGDCDEPASEEDDPASSNAGKKYGIPMLGIYCTPFILFSFW